MKQVGPEEERRTGDVGINDDSLALLVSENA
jgi:hypothetical protein